jgi:hypothetical protein
MDTLMLGLDFTVQGCDGCCTLAERLEEEEVKEESPSSHDDHYKDG